MRPDPVLLRPGARPILVSGCVALYLAAILLSVPACLPTPVQGEPVRLIEPVLASPPAATAVEGARRVRLRAVTGRGHLRQALLHLRPDGSLTEDERWLWTVAPADYLREALEQALAADPDVELVDRDPELDLEVELQVFAVDGDDKAEGFVVAARVQAGTAEGRLSIGRVEVRLPRSTGLPGDLGEVAGRALAEAAVRVISFALGRTTGGG